MHPFEIALRKIALTAGVKPVSYHLSSRRDHSPQEITLKIKANQ
jgi:hypothetical protein